jgi:hypothetical protein
MGVLYCNSCDFSDLTQVTKAENLCNKKKCIVLRLIRYPCSWFFFIDASSFDTF